MSARILDGKSIAGQIRQELKDKISKLKQHPVLAIVLAGDNPASSIYVRNKQKAAAEMGIKTELYIFDNSVKQTELEQLIEKLNQDKNVNGIMVQLPLPEQINSRELLKEIDPLKDVDGFHPKNIGLLQNQDSSAVIAATPKGILRLLEQANIDLCGKHALVIGRSQIVGKPAAMLLLNKDCTVTIAHSKTKNLKSLVEQADIVVAACGCPKLVKGDWIKENAIIIDVGINRVDGKLCGDVEFETAVRKASVITPVPGGVGPMTIAMLLENTYLAYLKQNNG